MTSHSTARLAMVALLLLGVALLAVPWSAVALRGGAWAQEGVGDDEPLDEPLDEPSDVAPVTDDDEPLDAGPVAQPADDPEPLDAGQVGGPIVAQPATLPTVVPTPAPLPPPPAPGEAAPAAAQPKAVPAAAEAKFFVPFRESRCVFAQTGRAYAAVNCGEQAKVLVGFTDPGESLPFDLGGDPFFARFPFEGDEGSSVRPQAAPAAAGNGSGGSADAEADGGTIGTADVNSGGNRGETIVVGDSIGSPGTRQRTRIVEGEAISNETVVVREKDGGVEVADDAGGNGNGNRARLADLGRGREARAARQRSDSRGGTSARQSAGQRKRGPRPAGSVGLRQTAGERSAEQRCRDDRHGKRDNAADPNRRARADRIVGRDRAAARADRNDRRDAPRCNGKGNATADRRGSRNDGGRRVR